MLPPSSDAVPPQVRKFFIQLILRAVWRPAAREAAFPLAPPVPCNLVVPVQPLDAVAFATGGAFSRGFTEASIHSIRARQTSTPFSLARE